MATVYAPPEEIGDAPEMIFGADRRFDWDATHEAETKYMKSIQEWARKQYPNDKRAGMTYYAGVADGRAHYVVLRSRPLELIHVPIGDAYVLPAAYERGLRVSDIDSHQRFQEIWDNA